MDNRGVSEALGYVLMFSVTLLAMSTVVVFGVTALDDVRSSAVTDSGEFAMQTLEADVHALYRGSAVSRVTELTLDRASLVEGPETTVAIRAEVGGTTELDETQTVRSIVYRTDDADIAYENTLVAREQERGAVSVSESLFVTSSDRAIVPVVRTVPVEGNASAGGTTQIRTYRNRSEQHVVRRTPGDPVEVQVDVDTTSGLADVWERELNRRLERAPGLSPTCFQPNDGEVRCTFETDSLVVSVVEIEYALG